MPYNFELGKIHIAEENPQHSNQPFVSLLERNVFRNTFHPQVVIANAAAVLPPDVKIHVLHSNVRARVIRSSPGLQPDFADPRSVA